MHRGYVTIHRKVLDNPIVFKDADHVAVWVYLLLNATHKKYLALFQGRLIELQPGQLITGRLSIAGKLKINQNKVQRILKLFKNEQLIEQQTCNQNRLITLASWNKYQNNEQQNEQRVNNERTTGEQRVNTNKNVNNVETQKTYNNDFDDFWQAYPKKESKKGALKKFQQIIKSGEATAEQLILGAKAYRKKVAGQNPKYTKQPTTWLNNGCWNDEAAEAIPENKTWRSEFDPLTPPANEWKPEF